MLYSKFYHKSKFYLNLFFYNIYTQSHRKLNLSPFWLPQHKKNIHKNDLDWCIGFLESAGVFFITNNSLNKNEYYDISFFINYFFIHSNFYFFSFLNFYYFRNFFFSSLFFIGFHVHSCSHFHHNILKNELIHIEIVLFSFVFISEYKNYLTFILKNNYKWLNCIYFFIYPFIYCNLKQDSFYAIQQIAKNNFLLQEWKLGFILSHYDPQLLYKLRKFLGFGYILKYTFDLKHHDYNSISFLKTSHQINSNTHSYFKYIISDLNGIGRLLCLFLNHVVLNKTKKQYLDILNLFNFFATNNVGCIYHNHDSFIFSLKYSFCLSFYSFFFSGCLNTFSIHSIWNYTYTNHNESFFYLNLDNLLCFLLTIDFCKNSLQQKQEQEKIKTLIWLYIKEYNLHIICIHLKTIPKLLFLLFKKHINFWNLISIHQINHSFSILYKIFSWYVYWYDSNTYKFDFFIQPIQITNFRNLNHLFISIIPRIPKKHSFFLFKNAWFSGFLDVLLCFSIIFKNQLEFELNLYIYLVKENFIINNFHLHSNPNNFLIHNTTNFEQIPKFFFIPIPLFYCSNWSKITLNEKQINWYTYLHFSLRESTYFYKYFIFNSIHFNFNKFYKQFNPYCFNWKIDYTYIQNDIDKLNKKQWIKTNKTRKNIKNEQYFRMLFTYLNKYTLKSKKNLSFLRFKKILRRLNDKIIRTGRSFKRFKRLFNSNNYHF
jgi:hypothetical protein